MSDTVATTDRLRLRKLELGDAPFVLELLNQPSFLEFIGDRGVHSLDDARSYIEDGPLASYRERGYGPYLVEESASGASVGLCGLYQREFLDYPDLGFALSEGHFRRGYGTEAARRVIELARDDFAIPRLAAIVSPNNLRSRALLRKLGFAFTTSFLVPGEDRDVHLFDLTLTGEP